MSNLHTTTTKFNLSESSIAQLSKRFDIISYQNSHTKKEASTSIHQRERREEEEGKMRRTNPSVRLDLRRGRGRRRERGREGWWGRWMFRLPWRRCSEAGSGRRCSEAGRGRRIRGGGGGARRRASYSHLIVRGKGVPKVGARIIGPICLGVGDPPWVRPG